MTEINGRMVDDADGPGLAAAALDVLDHLGDYDRAAIAAECRDRFSLEAVTRRYEAVLWSTAGRPPRPVEPALAFGAKGQAGASELCCFGFVSPDRATPPTSARTGRAHKEHHTRHARSRRQRRPLVPSPGAGPGPDPARAPA